MGHIRLCGVLHICWQTNEGVSGRYMIVLLYRDWLCLAISAKSGQIYTIQACISVNNIKVETADNGRGKPISLGNPFRTLIQTLWLT